LYTYIKINTGLNGNLSFLTIFANSLQACFFLEYLEVTKQGQQENDPQNDQASLEQVFQQVLPEEADDDERDDDPNHSQDQPDDITGKKG
jgi:hypothetical protein